MILPENRQGKNGKIGGLGWLMFWDSNRGALKQQNYFHKDVPRNPNHRAPKNPFTIRWIRAIMGPSTFNGTNPIPWGGLVTVAGVDDRLMQLDVCPDL